MTIGVGPACADFTIIQIGDSVGSNVRNRVAANVVFGARPFPVTWVGHHLNPPTYAESGWTYNNMLNGKTGSSVPGLATIVQDIGLGNLPVPDAVFLLGGYNNVFGEAVDSDMLSSFATLQNILNLIESDLPGTDVFLANLTLLTGTSAHKHSNVLTLNGLIATEVASRPQVHLVDNFTVITADDLRSDGLHLDNEGQEKIGIHFANTVLAVVSIPEPTGFAPLLALVGWALKRKRKPLPLKAS